MQCAAPSINLGASPPGRTAARHGQRSCNSALLSSHGAMQTRQQDSTTPHPHPQPVPANPSLVHRGKLISNWVHAWRASVVQKEQAGHGESPVALISISISRVSPEFYILKKSEIKRFSAISTRRLHREQLLRQCARKTRTGLNFPQVLCVDGAPVSPPLAAIPHSHLEGYCRPSCRRGLEAAMRPHRTSMLIFSFLTLLGGVIQAPGSRMS